ncbi:hypothetical protein KSP39_PZI012757 [Platanthera zijinensis]|uniref:Uncharacterized protein n=1 Tax=Platanthera zijinensis TaxID=2320716 RepID=A0AAP0BEH8_9ASPA
MARPPRHSSMMKTRLPRRCNIKICGVVTMMEARVIISARGEFLLASPLGVTPRPPPPSILFGATPARLPWCDSKEEGLLLRSVRRRRNRGERDSPTNLS